MDIGTVVSLERENYHDSALVIQTQVHYIQQCEAMESPLKGNILNDTPNTQQ